MEEETNMICKLHRNVKAPSLCPVCLLEERNNLRDALKTFMDAWIQPKPRSMAQLKDDMDIAYQKGQQLLKE